MRNGSAEPAGGDEGEAAHVFDQTNGVLGERADAAPEQQAARSCDVPVATNLLFGGQ